MIYKFHERNNYAQSHMHTIENYLLSIPITQKISNVENHKLYQKDDIDLIWHGRFGSNSVIQKSIEVKVDSYHNSGNIFFEIISNDNKHSDGCLLISKADYLFYFFPDINLLYSFKLKQFKEWTLLNKHRFKIKKCENTTYNSYGYLIPRIIIESECSFYKKIYLQPNLKNHNPNSFKSSHII